MEKPLYFLMLILCRCKLREITELLIVNRKWLLFHSCRVLILRIMPSLSSTEPSTLNDRNGCC